MQRWNLRSSRGGFARYAIDEQWTIPHFEKMLYDNAILSKAYLEAWKLSRKDVYKETVINTLDYVLRELQYKEGGFFSGEDSDTEGKEGFYYTWTPAEIQDVIPGEDGEICSSFRCHVSRKFRGEKCASYRSCYRRICLFYVAR
ncbi:MAG: hypothetical protein LVR00_01765 [Rhabdochlamydiaceae bacterium]